MIRALTEHLPVMVMPRWVSVLAQPIGIQDLISYLVQALDIPIEASEVVEIGGADQLSYRELMKEYARLRNLKRVMIPLPVLTPRLSSLWLGFDYSPLCARRTKADREHQTSNHRYQQSRPRIICIAAQRSGAGYASRAGERGSKVRGDALV